MTPDGTATTTRSPFRLAITVATRIDAPAREIWHLLMDIGAQRSWNSTLARIDGKVELGNKVSFAVRDAPKQTFSPTVVAYDEGRSMVWRLGVPGLTSDRTYRLQPGTDGSTTFELDEVFRGLLLPIVVRTFPDFGRMFEQTAADLKVAAEASARR
jgi:hypothetical protein